MESSWKQQNRNPKQKKGRKFITIEEWELKQWQKFEPRNWLDLPSELMAMILMRLSAVEINENAQLVCSSWRQICKDSLIWKHIDTEKMFEDTMEYYIKYKKISHFRRYHMGIIDKLISQAVDRSCGQLVDVNLHNACDKLLNYVADRSPQLTRLRLIHPYGLSIEGLSKALLKLPLLTCIDLTLWESVSFSESAIEAIGRCCPLLRSFRFNSDLSRYFFLKSCEENRSDEERYRFFTWQNDWEINYNNKLAFAIAANMPGIHHLKLLGSRLSNCGLKAILDGCSHLVSLDLRFCYYIKLEGDLGKRCYDQIKDFRGPSSDYTYDDYPNWLVGKSWYSFTMRTMSGSVDGSSYSDTSYDDELMSYFLDDYDEYLDYEYLEMNILSKNKKCIHRETRDLLLNSFMLWF